MTVDEVYCAAEAAHVEKESIKEVLEMFDIPEEEYDRGICGTCRNRKTEKCPYPKKSKLTDRCCCDYEGWE